MAVNQKRRAEKLLKARARAKERKKQRDQWQSQWAPDYPTFEEARSAGLDLRDIDTSPDFSRRFGIRKSSEVLLELIEPLNSHPFDSDKLLFLAQIGMTAWNLAVMPENQRLGMLNKTVRSMPEEMKAVLFGLIERKLSLFPDDDRFIMDVEIREEKDGAPTLLVLSAVVPPQNLH